MAFTKNQKKILAEIENGPIEIQSEWILYDNSVSQKYCYSGALMYWAATGLQNIGLVKVTQLSIIPGRVKTTRLGETGPTAIFSYRVEKQ